MQFSSLFSSSTGNCLLVADDKNKILIDCGVSGKQAINSLKQIGVNIDSIDAILVTHEHTDHIKGVGILSRAYNIPIYARFATWDAMKWQIGKIAEHNIKVIENPDFVIGEFCITSVSLSHDAADPCGYLFQSGDKKLTIATDTGCIFPFLLDQIIGSDFVFLESNHDIEMLRTSRYPEVVKRRILSDFGHLSNENAALTSTSLLTKGTVRIMLGHLSSENNCPNLAYNTVASSCELFGIVAGRDYELSVAPKNAPSGFIAV